MTNSRVVGIFGGTFDPVHFGHLRAAEEARELLSLDRMRLMPAGQPPHRNETFAAAEHRLAMLHRALAGYPELQADDREIRREGYSYMVETLAEIRSEEGDAPVLLMLGQDVANTLDAWHEWKRLFGLAHLVVMRRPESRHVYSGELFREIQSRLTTEPRRLRDVPNGLVVQLEVTQLAISSTDIRQRVAAGKSVRFLLPDSVIDYIGAHRLYLGSSEDETGPG